MTQPATPQPKSSHFVWVELAAGFAIAAGGFLHTLWALPTELAELRPSAHHSVSLLGLLLVAHSIGEIAEKLNWAGERVPGQEGFWGRFRRILAGRVVQVTAGILILLGGVGEIMQAATGLHTAGIFYQWGVILAGIMVVGRAGYIITEGTAVLREAHWGPSWLHDVQRFLSHPTTRAAMALALVVLAGLELAFPGAEAGEPGGETGAPIAPHGLAILGSVNLARTALDFAHGAKLAWTARSLVTGAAAVAEPD